MNYADFALPRTPPDNRNGITPEYEVSNALDTASIAEERRKLGFTDVLIAPGGAIATGQSALVATSGLPRRESILKAPVALHIALRSPGGGFGGLVDDGDGHGHDHLADFGTADTIDAFNGPTQAPGTPIAPAPRHARAPPARRRPAGSRRPSRAGGGAQAQYPTSLMGVVAHFRQAMLDAENHHERLGLLRDLGGPRPANDPALDALYARTKSRALPVWWEANTRDEIHRALDLAEEFGTDAVIVGGREAGKVVSRLRSKDIPVVLRLDFPDEVKVPTVAEYQKPAVAERRKTRSRS